MSAREIMRDGVRDASSVRSKLIKMAVFTTLAALLSASIAMLLLDLRTFQRYWVDDLTTQADIMANVTGPALSFNDADTAQQQLAVLRARPQILAGAVYTGAGAPFATYARSGADVRLPPGPQAPGYLIARGQLEVWHKIVENGEQIGTVYLRSRFGLLERLLNYGLILGGVMLGALVIAGLVASRLVSAIGCGPKHPSVPEPRFWNRRFDASISFRPSCSCLPGAKATAKISRGSNNRDQAPSPKLTSCSNDWAQSRTTRLPKSERQCRNCQPIRVWLAW